MLQMDELIQEAAAPQQQTHVEEECKSIPAVMLHEVLRVDTACLTDPVRMTVQRPNHLHTDACSGKDTHNVSCPVPTLGLSGQTFLAALLVVQETRFTPQRRHDVLA